MSNPVDMYHKALKAQPLDREGGNPRKGWNPVISLLEPPNPIPILRFRQTTTAHYTLSTAHCPSLVFLSRQFIIHHFIPPKG